MRLFKILLIASCTLPMMTAQAARVQANDLYGVWGALMEESNGVMIHMTQMSPNGTGADISSFMPYDKKQNKMSIKQEFKWTLNPETQEIIQENTRLWASPDGKSFVLHPNQNQQRRHYQVQIQSQKQDKKLILKDKKTNQSMQYYLEMR